MERKWIMKRKLGLYRGFNGGILGLYRDNGKENGNYYIKIGFILGLSSS